MTASKLPRALTEPEAATLAYMLSLDDPRLEPLRQQARYARAIDQNDCCATILLDVDHEHARPADGLPIPAVESESLNREDADACFELLLFLNGGWLSEVEIVHYGEWPPREFPPTEAFGRPFIRETSSGLHPPQP